MNLYTEKELCGFSGVWQRCLLCMNAIDFLFTHFPNNSHEQNGNKGAYRTDCNTRHLTNDLYTTIFKTYQAE